MYYYLKIAAENDVIIKGASKQAVHVDWFEVVTVDRVGRHFGSAIGHGASEILLTILEASPDLLRARARNTHLPVAILDAPGRREWYLLREVVIEDLRAGAGTFSDRDNVRLSLAFASLEAHHGAYAPTAAAGQAAKVFTSVGLVKLHRLLIR